MLYSMCLSPTALESILVYIPQVSVAIDGQKILQFFLSISHFLLVRLCLCLWSMLRSNPSYESRGTRAAGLFYGGVISSISRKGS